MRQFNVYSALVVPVPNETFEWFADASEGSSIAVSPVPNSTWPLLASSYTVTGGGTTAATAGPTGGVAADFECDPPATDVTSQSIVIASQDFISVCADVEVDPGDYFVWRNTTSTPVVITPDPANPDFWPLEAQAHTVPPNGYLTVMVPLNAATGGEYPLVITLEGGGAACPTDTNQPKIKVGSNFPT